MDTEIRKQGLVRGGVEKKREVGDATYSRQTRHRLESSDRSLLRKVPRIRH